MGMKCHDVRGSTDNENRFGVPDTCCEGFLLLLQHSDLEKMTWREEKALYCDTYYVPALPFINPEQNWFTFSIYYCLLY